MTEVLCTTDTINAHFNELAERYKGLALKYEEPGQWIIHGQLAFRAEYNGVPLADTFDIRVILPDDYPAKPPSVSETGGRIPREIDFHVYSSGNFCLGARIEVRKRFLENPNLLHFIDDLVVPFLYAFVYKSWHGEMPWGELSHGSLGVLEYYNELFHVSGFQPSLNLLELLQSRLFPRTWTCPCGSKRKLRKCHGPQLKELVHYCTPEEAQQDRYLIIGLLERVRDEMQKKHAM